MLAHVPLQFYFSFMTFSPSRLWHHTTKGECRLKDTANQIEINVVEMIIASLANDNHPQTLTDRKKASGNEIRTLGKKISFENTNRNSRSKNRSVAHHTQRPMRTMATRRLYIFIVMCFSVYFGFFLRFPSKRDQSDVINFLVIAAINGSRDTHAKLNYENTLILSLLFSSVSTIRTPHSRRLLFVLHSFRFRQFFLHSFLCAMRTTYGQINVGSFVK